MSQLSFSSFLSFLPFFFILWKLWLKLWFWLDTTNVPISWVMKPKTLDGSLLLHVWQGQDFKKKKSLMKLVFCIYLIRVGHHVLWVNKLMGPVSALKTETAFRRLTYFRFYLQLQFFWLSNPQVLPGVLLSSDIFFLALMLKHIFKVWNISNTLVLLTIRLIQRLPVRFIQRTFTLTLN